MRVARQGQRPRWGDGVDLRTWIGMV